MRKPEQVDELVERTVKHFGRIDILVNNAAGNFICRAEDLSPNGWNAVVGIVLNGTFYCSRAVGRHMIERGRGGSIVSILANYVWTGSAGTVHSAAAKAGVMSLTQTLAVEWARHEIRVNAVAPGPIESPGAAKQLWNSPEAVERITDMVPLKRWGKPDDVADAVAFLVSEHAGYITGEVLTVDGGAWLGRGPFQFLPPAGGVTGADAEASASPRERRLAYFAWVAVCLIWGTTYLGIRITLETMPPALMSAAALDDGRRCCSPTCARAASRCPRRRGGGASRCWVSCCSSSATAASCSRSSGCRAASRPCWSPRPRSGWQASKPWRRAANG